MATAVEPLERRLLDVLGRQNPFTIFLQSVIGLAGAVGAFTTEWKRNPYGLVASITLVFVALCWFAVARWLGRRRPRVAVLPPEQSSRSSYLRGPLPFEAGEKLLGRDAETGQLLAMIRSLEFRIGFVSGDAGAGKTSLLRCRVVPELAKEGRYVIYVKRTGGDPMAAIRRAVREQHVEGVPEGLPPLSGGDAADNPLADLMGAAGDREIVIVIDQFEEYFVSGLAASTRDSFYATLRQLLDEPRIRILLSLRKEFVDDLLDFGQKVEELRSTRWRMPLRNFRAEIARAILSEVATAEHLPFSEELMDLAIADLARDQRVRPVEFQIVLTRLREQNIADAAAFRAAGGAHGVIASFVSETIVPPGQAITPLEQEVGRRVLRALCNERFTTRRPVGLTVQELEQRLGEDVAAVKGIQADALTLADAVRDALTRFRETYIVIAEDQSRFNLAHDYLAPAVRDATADVESVEERATRTLEQYVQQARVDAHTVIRWSTARFVKQFANRELLASTEVQKLLRRSARRRLATIAGVAIVSGVVLAVVLPAGVRYPVLETASVAEHHIVLGDGRFLLERERAQAKLIDLAARPFRTRVIPVPVRVAHITPDGTMLVVQSADQKIYRIDVAPSDPLKAQPVGESIKWRKIPRLDMSDDGKWIGAISRDGGVYMWAVNGTPTKVGELPPRPVGKDSKAPTEEEIDTSERFDDKPLFGFIGKSDRAWFGDSALKLRIIDLAGLGSTQGEVVEGIEFHKRDMSLASSENGRWLAAAGAAGLVYVVDMTARSPRGIEVIRGTPDSMPIHGPTLAFSPDDSWLFARQTFESPYMANLAQPAKGAASVPVVSTPAVDLPRSHSDRTMYPVFSKAGTHVAAVAQDGNLYVWPLDNPPRAAAKPVMPDSSDGSPSDAFARTTSAIFCGDPERIVVGLNGGAVYSARLGDTAPKFERHGQVGNGTIRMRRSADSKTMVAYDELRVIAGPCGGELATVAEPGGVESVVGSGQGMVVISRKSVTRYGRKLYIWGLPVFDLGWPALAKS